MPPVPIPLSTLVASAMERIVALLIPPGGEPCPLQDGADPSEWATAIGIDTPPHPFLIGRHADPLESGGHVPSDVAHVACQRLVFRGFLDRVGGLPVKYRPRLRFRRTA